MVYTEEALNQKLYKELVSIAKGLEVKANGKKEEIVARIIEAQSNSSPTTPKTTTTTTTKKQPVKRKLEAKIPSDDEEEEETAEDHSEQEEDSEEDSEEEMKVEKPIAKRGAKKAPAKPAAAGGKKKTAAKNAAKAGKPSASKKLKVDKKGNDDEEEEEEEEEETTTNDDEMNVDPNNNNIKSPDSNKIQNRQFKKGIKSVHPIGKWLSKGSVHFFLDEVISKSKIAAFDMDHTIIKTKKGGVHPINSNDWLWWNPVVPEKLKQLHKDGYHVVIFSNQGGIKHGNEFNQGKLTEISNKIRMLASELTIPLNAFIAAAEDDMKKPNDAMWRLMLEECTDGSDIPINSIDCFYCGDAAGRPENWKPNTKADFSSSDLGFAKTIGIDFKTPEVYFLNESPFDVNLSTLIPSAPVSGDVLVEGGSITLKEFEMVMFFGYPASGKSTFAQKHFKPAKYEIINGDTMGSIDKQLKIGATHLASKKSICVDNTNGNSGTRTKWINLAKQHNCPVRLFIFNTSFDLAMHLNYYRERTGGVKHISQMVYYTFRKALREGGEPTLKEGFKEIKHINFILDLKPEQLTSYNIPSPKAKAGKTN